MMPDVVDSHVAVRRETITTGFDDFLELLGDPPFSTGLRVPPLVGPLYRFLACVADLSYGDTVVGLRQFASIAAYLPQTGVGPPPAPVYPEWRPIVTPGWRFSDTAPLTWIVTLEPLFNFHRVTGPFDQDSFILRDTTGPALVYETAAFPVLPLLPGYLGLSAYTPPPIRGHKVALLRDIRFPQQQNEFHALRLPMRSPTRVRVYVEAEQTNPETRLATDLTTLLTPAQLSFVGGMVPEEQFLQDFRSAVLHAVGAALLIDREGIAS
jgi:hypothetical protein